MAEMLTPFHFIVTVMKILCVTLQSDRDESVDFILQYDMNFSSKV